MKIRGFLTAAAGCLALAIGSMGAAQADEAWQYSGTGAQAGGAGKDLLEFYEFTYTEVGGVETFAAEIKFTPEIVKDNQDGGFWLVVSDGPNPKNQIGEYAILYADLDDNRITAYEYNGDNNASSFSNPGNNLGVFDGVMNYTNNAGNAGNDGLVTFSLDVTSINAQALGSEWDGISFGENIGVWFHFAENLTANYSGHELTKFDLPHQGYVDFQSKPTTGCDDLPPDFPGCNPVVVSEPGSVALLGLGLVGLAAYRRRSA